MPGPIGPKHPSTVHDVQTSTPAGQTQGPQKAEESSLPDEPISLKDGARQQATDRASMQNLSGQMLQQDLNAQFETRNADSKSNVVPHGINMYDLSTQITAQEAHLKHLEKKIEDMWKEANPKTELEKWKVLTSPEWQAVNKELDEARDKMVAMRKQYEKLSGLDPTEAINAQRNLEALKNIR